MDRRTGEKETAQALFALQNSGGGTGAEGGDTQLGVLPFQTAIERVWRGEISDAKTIVALQHLALLKTGIR